MQSISRFNLCLFPNVTDNDECGKLNIKLNRLVENCKKDLKSASNKRLVTGQVMLIPGSYMTIAAYNNRMFMGFYEKGLERIIFCDDSNLATKMTRDHYDRLWNSFKNSAISDNTIINFITTAWEKTFPLLDKVIELEHIIDHLSECNEDFQVRNLTYNEFVDDLVNRYERGENIANIQINRDYIHHYVIEYYKELHPEEFVEEIQRENTLVDSSFRDKLSQQVGIQERKAKDLLKLNKSIASECMDVANLIREGLSKFTDDEELQDWLLEQDNHTLTKIVNKIGGMGPGQPARGGFEIGDD